MACNGNITVRASRPPPSAGSSHPRRAEVCPADPPHLLLNSPFVFWFPPSPFAHSILAYSAAPPSHTAPASDKQLSALASQVDPQHLRPPLPPASRYLATAPPLVQTNPLAVALQPMVPAAGNPAATPGKLARPTAAAPPTAAVGTAPSKRHWRESIMDWDTAKQLPWVCARRRTRTDKEGGSGTGAQKLREASYSWLQWDLIRSRRRGTARKPNLTLIAYVAQRSCCRGQSATGNTND